MRSQKHPSKTANKTDEIPDPVDQIFMHFDGIKDTLRFRLADYGDDGALSEDQIQTLAERFDLDVALVEDLSVLLGYSLDVDSEVNPVRVKRASIPKRGRPATDRFVSTYHDDDGPILVRPRDKRETRDERRLKLVESCCYIWLDAGRRLTFTSYFYKAPDQKRTGPLLELIKAVVKLVTLNETTISGETLRRDIELVRRRFERRGDLFKT